MLVVILVADKSDRQPASAKSKQLKEYLLLRHVPILWRWKEIRGLLADSFTIILQPGTRYQTTFEIRCVHLTVFVVTCKLFFSCSTSIHSALGASRLCAIQIYYWHWQCRHPTHKIATDINGRQCQTVWRGSYVASGLCNVVLICCRNYMPSLEEYFETAIEQSDPDGGIEEQYKWVDIVIQCSVIKLCSDSNVTILMQCLLSFQHSCLSIVDCQRPWSFVQDLRRNEICGWWWWWWW